MSAPEFALSPAPRGSTASRILFGVAGVIVLVLGTVVTLGGALIGVGAIVVAWAVMRYRKKQFTRLTAWVASVGATAAVLVLLLGATALLVPSAPTTTPQQRAEARARARDSMPDWLKQITPAGQPQNAAVDSMAEKLLESKPVMVWITTMGAVIGSSFLGAFAGTIGWGAVMLLYRGVCGDWPRQKMDEFAKGTPF